jgi:hypothetical protein
LGSALGTHMSTYPSDPPPPPSDSFLRVIKVIIVGLCFRVSVCLSVFARNIKCIEHHFPQLNRKSCVERSNSKFQDFSCSAYKSVLWNILKLLCLCDCALSFQFKSWFSYRF